MLTSQAQLSLSARFIKAQFGAQLAWACSVQNLGWLRKAQARYTQAQVFRSQKSQKLQEIVVILPLKITIFQGKPQQNSIN